MPGLQARIGPLTTQNGNSGTHKWRPGVRWVWRPLQVEGQPVWDSGRGSLGGRRHCASCGAAGQGPGGRRTVGPRSRRRRSPTSGLWRSTVIYYPTCTQLYKGPRKRKGCVEPTLSDALGAQSLLFVAQIQGAPVLLGGRYQASELKPEYFSPKSVKSETKSDDDGCQAPCSQVICGPGGNPRKKPRTLELPESRPRRRALVGRA